MIVAPTRLPGVVTIEPRVFRDDRGFLVETFHAERYLEEAGIGDAFVQDNLSHSRRGVLRGLHAQRERPQGKLVRVSRGVVFTVAVDIDSASETFRQWVGVELSAESQRQLWIPRGFAHGFQVLSESADYHYKCTDYYRPDDEIGVVWSDPELAIDWPLPNPVLSEKDRSLPTLAELTA